MENDVQMPLYDVLINHGDFDKLLQIIDASEGIRTLLMEEEGPFTFFAPTDAAFDDLEEMLASKNMSLIGILANEDLVGKILSHHLLEGKVLGDRVMTMNNKSTTLMDGQTSKITVNEDIIKLGEAIVVETDLEASNGVIHSISKVMLPEGLNL